MGWIRTDRLAHLTATQRAEFCQRMGIPENDQETANRHADTFAGATTLMAMAVADLWAAFKREATPPFERLADWLAARLRRG